MQKKRLTHVNVVRFAAMLSPMAAAVMMAGCGGGGTQDGPAGVTNPSVTPSAVVFTGVAATGAPMSGASIQVLDAIGDAACTTTTDSQGHYSCTLAANASAPFTVVAYLGDDALFSSAATATSGVINVTPLTTLIVSRLSPSGDPAKIVDEIKANPALVTVATLASKVAQVSALIAPLTGAVGDAVNPISGPFIADGTGHDKVLDSLQINIRPAGAESSIQLTMKVKPASDNSAPIEVSFKSGDATPAAPSVTIKPQDLVEDGIAARVVGFFHRMEDCYALPLAQRIASTPAGATQVSGTASSVSATACRQLFVDDDPGSYKDNGLVVGSTGAYPGMYREASTGARFERGSFQYQYANGDIFVTFRSLTTAGAAANSTLTLRSQDGKLKAIGNQNQYDANVRPYVVDREFPLQPAFSWLGTGYNVVIPNRVDAVTGLPLFKEAIVTTPAGSQLVYRPLPGRSILNIVRGDGSTSGSSVEIFAAAYAQGSTAGNPSTKDGGFIYSSVQRSEDELRAVPDQGVWTVEWVHVDTATPNVKQTHRTIARTPTLAEVRHQKFAQFSDALKTQWLARADVAGYLGLTFSPTSATTPNVLAVQTMDGADGWTVHDLAVAPTSVTVFGSAFGTPSFNDSVGLLSVDRKTNVTCSKQSSADVHCDATTGVNQFAENGRVWTVELFGRTLDQLDVAKHLALFKLAE